MIPSCRKAGTRTRNNGRILPSAFFFHSPLARGRGQNFRVCLNLLVDNQLT